MMDASEKLNWFSSELNALEKFDSNVKTVAETLIQDLPDYFFTVPASSSGKHHAKFARGEHGLLNHTKAAFYVALELLQNPLFNCFGKDGRKEALALLAILLHDGCKRGTANESEEHTRFDHPALAALFIDARTDKIKTVLTDGEIEFLKGMVLTHMGPWTTSKYSPDVLRAPETDAQKFVHLCDYMASRERLEFRIKESTD